MRAIRIGIVCLALLVGTSAAWAKKKPRKVEVTNLPVVQVVQEQNPTTKPLGPSKPSQLLSLHAKVNDCPGGFTGARAIDQRLASDGTSSSFTIPEGSVFVITGVEVWMADTNASTNAPVNVGVPCGAGCMHGVFDLMVSTDGSGRGGSSLQLNPGVPIKAGTTLCVADVYYGSPNTYGILRGYLTPDE